MARLSLAVVLLMGACAYGAFTTCNKDYNKLGCFWEDNTNMELIINDRDPSSPAYSGHMLDWNNFGKSIHSLACRCSAKAKAEGYAYFSLRFWAECWAGRKHEEVDAVVKDPTKRTNQCANDAFKTCDDAHDGECVGRRNAEYMYTFAQAAEESLDGGWSEYSEWSDCSSECGPGIQTRERTCTEPEPLGAGKDCVGESTETKTCEVKKCPIDGGLSSWSKFTTCTRSCGGGASERVRFCNNPKPQFGGKPCNGSLFETKSCGVAPCPVNGGYTSWSSFGSCSKSCGGGSQIRTRTCTNPAPAFNGTACAGSASQSQPCNSQNCPINGGWSGYGSYGSCSKVCGSGTKTRSRSCNNPAPQFGGASCSGSSTSSTSCNTNRCATKSDVEAHVKSLLRSYGNSKGNSDMASTIQTSLQNRYTGHYFSTMVYNQVSGFDNHAIYGTNYVALFRTYNHNTVVAWVNKNKSINKSSASSALSKVTDSGDCYAKNQASAAWTKAGGNAVMAMVVRHGNGLRGSYSTAAGTFSNYRCKRSCDFWGNNCDHKSTLVMLYGSA